MFVSPYLILYTMFLAIAGGKKQLFSPFIIKKRLIIL
tara:strand:+ start:172 stop:282 length:111 start_codon:yes stop_codon:yes gene_type:complete